MISVKSIPVVNSDRLNQSIAQLGEIDKVAHGGVSRVAFTLDILDKYLPKK